VTVPADTRHVYTGHGSREILELLQGLFASELISPSGCIWLISPWISNIAVLDNSGNAFNSFLGEWACERVRLTTVLTRLMRHGTTVYVATRPEEHNVDFLRTLRSESAVLPHRLRVLEVNTLHSKGLLGDRYYLSGSMNITHNGVSFNDETIHFFTDAQVIAESRHVFESWWRDNGGQF